MVHYLDDYVIISPTYDGALEGQLTTIRVLRFLGFHVAWTKVTPPSVHTVYLGNLIDTDSMCLSLPREKVDKFKRYVTKYLNCKYITKKELECLNGLLAHCSQIVQGGRVFTRRCFDMYQCIVACGHHRIKISVGMTCDLQWWADYAPYFNGESLIPFELYPDKIWTDASMKGFGAVMGVDWLAGDWGNTLVAIELSPGCEHFAQPPALDENQSTNINVLELFAVIAALERWATLLGNHSVTLMTDNTQVLSMLTHNTSVNKQCMNWLRRLFWLCMHHNIKIIPSYVPSEQNVAADSLSRLLYFTNFNKLHDLLYSYGLCCHDELILAVSSRFSPAEA